MIDEILLIVTLVGVCFVGLERVLAQCGVLKGVHHIDLRCGQCNMNLSRNASPSNSPVSTSEPARRSLDSSLRTIYEQRRASIPNILIDKI